MGRGSSKIGGGDTRRASGIEGMIENAMKGISPDGQPVSLLEVNMIGNSTYQLQNLDKVSNQDRTKLAGMIYDSIMIEGALAKNNLTEVQHINNGGTIANMNISQFSSKQLSDLIHIASKAGYSPTSTIIKDSLRLLTYYNS